MWSEDRLVEGEEADMSKELKPCPFCGGEAVLDIEDISLLRLEFRNHELQVRVRIICSKCHMTDSSTTACIEIDSKTAQTMYTLWETRQVKYIVKRWNRRAT